MAIKGNWNPLWVAAPAALLGALYYSQVPGQQSFAYWLLAGLGMIVLAQVGMSFLGRLNPPPVPNYAIANLIAQCESSHEEWVLVEFEPTLDLHAARARVGSQTYSQADRRRTFMMKAQLYAPHAPGVAFFYSANKGYLLAHRAAVQRLVAKYGKWTIDSWYSFAGAAKGLGLEAESLDEPKLVRFGVDR